MCWSEDLTILIRVTRGTFGPSLMIIRQKKALPDSIFLAYVIF